MKGNKRPGFSSLYSWSSCPLFPMLRDQDPTAVTLKNIGLTHSCFPQILTDQVVFLQQGTFQSIGASIFLSCTEAILTLPDFPGHFLHCLNAPEAHGESLSFSDITSQHRGKGEITLLVLLAHGAELYVPALHLSSQGQGAIPELPAPINACRT